MAEDTERSRLIYETWDKYAIKLLGYLKDLPNARVPIAYKFLSSKLQTWYRQPDNWTTDLPTPDPVETIQMETFTFEKKIIQPDILRNDYPLLIITCEGRIVHVEEIYD